jgi:5-methylcytosine-specific restriction endonuclease McrA
MVLLFKTRLCKISLLVDKVTGGDFSMLKTCSHCGKIVDRSHDCPAKPKRKKFNKSDADTFRNSRLWRKKSLEIRYRDKGLCQICMRKLYDTIIQYNFDNIEVHHIIPLAEDTSKGLTNTNLISLCKTHHYMADHDQIPRAELHKIAKTQETIQNIKTGI